MPFRGAWGARRGPPAAYEHFITITVNIAANIIAVIIVATIVAPSVPPPRAPGNNLCRITLRTAWSLTA